MGLLLCKETYYDTNVSTEGLESLRFASILYDNLNNFQSKVNEIYELSFSTKDTQIKGARQPEEVNESIKFVNDKFED